MELRLFEASPAWAIEADSIVGYDLSFTRGVRLQGLDTQCDTDAALESLSERLSQALSAFPEGAVVRFYSAEIGTYDELLAAYRVNFSASPVGEYVARKKVEQCHARLTPRRRELFCFVSTPGEISFTSHNASVLFRRSENILRAAATLHERKVAEVEQLLRTTQRALEGAGVRGEPLGEDDLFAVLWRLANPYTSRVREPPAYRKDYTLRAQLFASGLVNRADSFDREGLRNRVAVLKFPPRSLVATQALELQTLPFVHQLVVTLRRSSDNEAFRRIEMNRRQGHEINRLLAKLRGADRHAEMPDHLLLQQQQDVNDVLARLNQGEKLFDVATQVWFAAPSEEELRAHTEAVMARFRSAGQAEGAVEELRGRFAFLSMLPGHHALIGERFHPFLASRAADLVPVFQSWAGSPKPTALLSTRSKELVGWHPFLPELPAWNATIAGGTGSGKSFAARTLLTGWLASGGRVLVATRGRDYHRYAEIFGGRIQDVSIEDPELALGPFPDYDAVVSAEHQDVLFEHLSTILGVMIADTSTELGRVERRLLYRATQLTYVRRAAGKNAPTFVEWLESLVQLAAEDEETAAASRTMGRQLRFWLEGPHGHAFCRNRREMSDVPLAVWNLEQIADPDTQRVVLALLSGTISQSIKLGPTVVVLDEVWAILKSDTGASLVESLYRTVRKEGSAIWTISQSMNDYAALPDATRSAVLNNSAMKFFLAHDPSELATVRETFRLSDRETDLLASLRSEPGRFSEMLAFIGGRRQVLRLAPTGIEYWLATSHPRDREWERLAMQEHSSLQRFEILKHLARSYPHGAIRVEFAAA